MIFKHYERKEHAVYFLLIIVGFVILTRGYSATTIGTNVQSDGNFVLSSTTSSVQFANGWRMSQTAATTTEVSVTDSLSNSVLIFDEN